MIRKVWAWLETPKAFHIVSVIACIYFGISAIGEGRGYWFAANSMLMFVAIWALGYNSRKAAQPTTEGTTPAPTGEPK